jgi:twinkle protein
LRGSSAGLWCDYASLTDKGDVFDLWCKVKNETFRDAFPEICRWLGVSNIDRPKPKSKPPRPDTTGLSVEGRISPAVLAYLTGRALTKDTLKTYRIRSHRRPSDHNTDFVAFQFDCPAGDPVMLKSTGIKPKVDGKKDTWTTAPYYTLWGWWTVQPSDRAIVITEGEYDAMSVHQLNPGFPVLSLPAGSSNLTWIENDFDTLQRFEKIYICTDADEAGEKCAVEMAKRLGKPVATGLSRPSPSRTRTSSSPNAPTRTWMSSPGSKPPPLTILRPCAGPDPSVMT